MTTFTGSRILAEHRQKMELQRAIAARSAAPRQRSFAGAQISRLTSSLETWSGALNSDLDSGLAILRARSRTL